jgi:diguanylate cyclase (GGDEF)-like protein
MDLDCFKEFNDKFGHPAGDRCLEQVAVTLQGVLQRPADLLARYGGDEFAAILPGTHSEGARYIAEQFREALRSVPYEVDEKSLDDYVTVSIGICTERPDPSSSPEKLLSCADQALYRAKGAGRDRVNIGGEGPSLDSSG